MKRIFFRIGSKIGVLAAALLVGGAGCFSFSSGAGTSGPGGMFVSIDRGDNWQAISQLPLADGVESIAGASVYRLDTDPQDPSALYWASREAGLFYSFNDGKDWRRSPAPLNQGFVYSVVVHPKDKCTLFATNGREVFKSTDCARSWAQSFQETDPAVRITSIAMREEAPHYLYIAETNGDVLRSGNEGASWQRVNQFKTTLGEVYTDPLSTSTVYVASRQKGLFRSVDNGVTWMPLADTLASFTKSLEFRRLYLHPTKPGVIYWISRYGILVSEDSGSNWKAMQLVTPPGSVNIYGFAINAANINELYYTATVNGKSTFYRSFDAGATWVTKKLPSGQIPTALHVHAAHPEWVYVGFTIPEEK